ncbi:MAG: hypothetical protein JXB88_05250 [Spirochaetales bacterium]|nr:hypothetical protein [Spirochaetales bacterium]
MRTIDDINKQITTLKDKLDLVQGTQTEVYTRIVGYYRSIKNWNKGKREEYNYRVPFSMNKDYTRRVDTVTGTRTKTKV